MASIKRRANGSIEIRFMDHQGNRTSLYPGRIAIRDAEAIAAKVEHIVSRKVQGSEPDVAISQWIAGLSDKLHRKLAKLELVAPRQPAEPPAELAEPTPVPTIKQWTDSYIEKHPGKTGTIRQLTTAAKFLVEHFGTDKTLDTITPGHAEDYRKWLSNKKLAENTVRRRIGRAKQFFQAAVKYRLIPENPFADEVAAVRGNPDRMFMVPVEWIDRCIRKAPCEDWRIILAFARYAGMRAHECCIQRWDDIDLVNNRMIVRSNKSPAIRSCPIFPELRPHLLRAREMAPGGAELVVTRYGPDSNLRTTLQKIITRAGLVPWPKLMQNLRATRETELLACYPAKDVTSWLGNSPTVANNHYAMTMQASFNRATEYGAKIDGVTAGVSSKVPQKVPHTLQEKAGQRETGRKAFEPVNSNILEKLAMSLLDQSKSDPYGTRTRVAAVKGRCPRPLDEGAA